MDKESIYLLQKLDCNCNDCFFMERDFDAFRKWENYWKESELKEFENKKEKALKEAIAQNSDKLITKAKCMAFNFDRSGLIHYGKCKKFNKPVSFIPVTCQIETQGCFVHRKDGK